MKRNQSSITAQGIALTRYLESRRPAGERVCYDPLAKYFVSWPMKLLGNLFLGYGKRRSPGVFEFLVARTRYIDDFLHECIRQGIRQLVVLGAGFDSRPYRFEDLEPKVRVFEVDHPATQLDKLRRVKDIFGKPPEYVSFVPIDFTVETLEKLFPAGYQAGLKTLFIWEGVVYYLPADAVDSTLNFIVKNSAPESTVIFDYIYLEALQAIQKHYEVASMNRYRGITGEGLVFGIPRGKIEEFLKERGLVNIVDVNYADLEHLYFNGVNRDRKVATIYAIVHAAVPGKAIA
jgi:methyltransferase (TIGR00027 family)